MQRILVFVLVASLVAGAALADDAPLNADTAKTEGRAAQLIVDEQAGIVHILVEGREVVRVDADGLHVNGNITYSGTIADTGDGGHAE